MLVGELGGWGFVGLNPASNNIHQNTVTEPVPKPKLSPESNLEQCSLAGLQYDVTMQRIVS